MTLISIWRDYMTVTLVLTGSAMPHQRNLKAPVRQLMTGFLTACKKRKRALASRNSQLTANSNLLKGGGPFCNVQDNIRFTAEKESNIYASVNSTTITNITTLSSNVHSFHILYSNKLRKPISLISSFT